MKKRRPSRRWDRHGVSEIIANLLILGITVTLFSSVLMFVTQMPAPKQEVYTDFSATTEIQPAPPGNCWINVTNQGGQVLSDFRTKIYILKDDQAPIALKLSDSLVPLGSTGSTWDTGEMWIYRLTGVTTSTRLSIMVIDYVSNSMVWSSVLRGEGGGFSPVIGERGTTPTPSYGNTLIRFYASVMDPDGDLRTNSVFVNATSINGLSTFIQLTDTNNDGIFVSPGQYLADVNWNGKIVIVNATDKTNRVSTARMTLNIQPAQGTGGGGGGGLGAPPGNLNYSGLQGFNIFEWTDWNIRNYSANPKTYFTHNQNAVVVVASKYLVNLNNSNIILVMNPTSKSVFSAVSSPINQFVHYDFNSGYYVYNCTIKLGLIPDNAMYLLEAQLRDSWIPNNIFFMNQVISVGSLSLIPQFLTFEDSAYTVQSSEFNTIDKIYVEIRDIYGGPWNPNSGDVEIRDFFWNAQVKRAPPYVAGATSDTKYNGPVSNVWQLVSPATTYRFVISLYNATTGATWIPGENSYVLRYDMFKAGTETYLLSKVVKITAPMYKADVVVGGTSSGNGRFATYAGLFFYKNDNQWSPPDVLETSGDKQVYTPNIVLVRMGDIDGDLKNDFVVVRGTSKFGGAPYVLSAYFNHGSWVRLDVAVLPALPTQLSIGNVDLDNDLDIVVGYSGSVTQSGVGTNMQNPTILYRNDGLWTPSLIGQALSAVRVLKMADMDPPGTPGNDPLRSWDVVVGTVTGIVTIYKNTLGTGSAWTPTSISGTTADVYDWATNDINVYGSIVSGTYIQTKNPYQDDGIYEQLTEEWILQKANSWPTMKGPLDNVTDEVLDLKGGASTPYTVLPGHVANVNKWDSSGLTDTYSPVSVIFKARFKTATPGTYTANDKIAWSSGGPWNDMFAINNTGGNYVEKEWNITSYFPTTTTQLANLDVKFQNSDPGVSVDFDFWSINVTYITGDRLDHRWQFDLRPSINAGTPHVFAVYAQTSALGDGDKFRFSYSTDNITFTNLTLSPTSDVSSYVTPMVRYTANIPGTVSGTVYMRVVDVKTTSAPTAISYIRIGQMSVKTSAAVASIGTNVLGLDVRDMNGDGANDIVVVETSSTSPNPGKVWYALNIPAGILTNFKLVPGSYDYKAATSVSIGRFFGSNTKTDLDIMVATSTTMYFIKNNGGGSLVVDSQTFVPVGGIKKALVGDVDGNGWSDIVVVTSTDNVLLYSYYGPGGWQLGPIDNLGDTCSVNDADLGVLQV